MADSPSAAAASGPAQSTAKGAKPQNPAMRMIGMPNFRFKLPSRNWMIFLTITGSFATALIYDRREKTRTQQKWCDLVAHLSKESLPVDQTRRKLTVYLAAPPGDGLRPARDHFKEYVKPILVAAALDYHVIEGRREGDVRAVLSERIRKLRRKAGEPTTVVDEASTEDVVADARRRIGVTDEPGPKGDLVIGRHTWKEYVRGLHEGWLGPLDPPQPPAEPVDAPSLKATETNASADGTPAAENPEKSEIAEKKEEKPKPTGPTPAYIATADYSSQNLPQSIPQAFDSSIPITFPHILGFLNTPIRLYRYLNKRHLAEEVGRDVAGVVLASNSRPYHDNSFSADSEYHAANVDATLSPAGNYEQQSILKEEELEWHKSVHKKDESNPDKEREWINEVVLDPRIASRMQRFVLSPEEEARSQRIREGSEYIIGEDRPAPVPFWKHLWIKYGYGEDEATLRRKPIVGNLDEEDSQ
ncbi:hypothetical protein EYZ11_001583 [Aspergillus tanneri]|uniref:Mitochondrial import inner membrane translocase subunit TIM54 n=1 Tax=Aspergillus tanneri TaxID=1220188 RepID=A0A4S3JT48_9EURO|nr:mitochondrial import inner membrane translocase subunit tim54 [Aspergillus tanneri]KAA8648628.1 mitochondrial import inner membrane translocase subunit tim54 [Aspergillus tanneri]THC98946.1 hypothetical protein EYZ11_001583 [Aspergillus tanneri]